jgi:hypothetical protein
MESYIQCVVPETIASDSMHETQVFLAIYSERYLVIVTRHDALKVRSFFMAKIVIRGTY